MSVESIYGGWDTPRLTGDSQSDRLQRLWHTLAAQHVGTPHFQPNSGLSQRKHEIIMLWNLFLIQSPTVIVEIGTAQGGTFAAWCQLASPNATLISVDACVNDCLPRPGQPIHAKIYDGTLKMTEQGGGTYSLRKQGQTVHAINGWTHDPAVQEKVKSTLNGRKIDFLFHDASHSARMCREDMVWMWPLVAEGGILALHDIQHSAHPDCDKHICWKEMVETLDYSARYEFCGNRHDDSMGIGILLR